VERLGETRAKRVGGGLQRVAELASVGGVDLRAAKLLDLLLVDLERVAELLVRVVARGDDRGLVRGLGGVGDRLDDVGEGGLRVLIRRDDTRGQARSRDDGGGGSTLRGAE